MKKQLYTILLIICFAQLSLAIYDMVTHHELAGLVFFSCIIFCVLMAFLVCYVCAQAESLDKQRDIVFLLKQLERSAYRTEIAITQMWSQQQDQQDASEAEAQLKENNPQVSLEEMERRMETKQ